MNFKRTVILGHPVHCKSQEDSISNLQSPQGIFFGDWKIVTHLNQCRNLPRFGLVWESTQIMNILKFYSVQESTQNQFSEGLFSKSVQYIIFDI